MSNKEKNLIKYQGDACLFPSRSGFQQYGPKQRAGRGTFTSSINDLRDCRTLGLGQRAIIHLNTVQLTRDKELSTTHTRDDLQNPDTSATLRPSSIWVCQELLISHLTPQNEPVSPTFGGFPLALTWRHRLLLSPMTSCQAGVFDEALETSENWGRDAGEGTVLICSIFLTRFRISWWGPM